MPISKISDGPCPEIQGAISNAHEGGALLKRCGFEGLSDLSGLDLERRRVIADLVLNYNGW